MDIYTPVIDWLQTYKGKWSVIAQETGISKRTIEKIARKEIPEPGIFKIQKLHAFFSKKRR